ncbi:bestrophin-like domain [Pseudooceanicola sp. 502str34]
MAATGIALLFVAGTILIAWSVYFATRALVGKTFGSDTEALASSVIFRVSALHGLILALVFAQELLDYNELQRVVLQEATAVADIYNEMRRYGGEDVAPVQAALSDYLQVVSGPEWAALGETQRLTGEGWRIWDDIYGRLLDLPPDTPRESALRDHMLSKAQTMAALRQEREATALHGISPLFWFAALAGVVLVTIPYFIFAPTRLHLVLLSIYGGFTGLVMYVIFAFSDPFGGPGAMDPAPFTRLLETEIGHHGTR